MNEEHVSAAGLAAINSFQKKLFKNSGEAVICQTPFRTFVQEATGFSTVTPEARVSTWTAEVVGINIPGKLSVVFESSADGGDFIGRDSLVVSVIDWRGRPIELIGDAFHVIKHLDIVVIGAIRYSRKTRESNIALNRSAAS